MLRSGIESSQGSHPTIWKDWYKIQVLTRQYQVSTCQAVKNTHFRNNVKLTCSLFLFTTNLTGSMIGENTTFHLSQLRRKARIKSVSKQPSRLQRSQIDCKRQHRTQRSKARKEARRRSNLLNLTISKVLDRDWLSTKITEHNPHPNCKLKTH